MWTSKISRELSIPLVTLLLLSTAAFAQQQSVTFDPGRTTVTFALAGELNYVRGYFKLKTGTIRFDETTGDASGALIVDASSAVTGNRSRDDKLRKDLLEAGTYPDIVFIPTKVTGHVPRSGGSRISVDGRFRMHGVEQPMTLLVYLSVNGEEVAVKTGFEVPYERWRVPPPRKFLVHLSRQAAIHIVAVGNITREQASITR